MKSKTANNKGFTLIELLVAMTVFLIVIGIATGVFIQTLRTQRTLTSFSEGMDNVTSALEQMAREARTGFSFDIVGDGLQFTSAASKRIDYFLSDGAIVREVGGVGEPITSPDVVITNLEFELSNTKPQRITIFTTVQGSREYDVEVDLQTTISSRTIAL